jgi:hypothetical protein
MNNACKRTVCCDIKPGRLGLADRIKDLRRVIGADEDKKEHSSLQRREFCK